MGAPKKKKCSRCGKVKPFGEFSKCAANKTGRQSACRVCDHEIYLRDRTSVLARAKKRMQWQENKVRYKGMELRRRFGITLEEYNVMLDDQNGVCKICKMPETREVLPGTIASLSVDHDHATGEVRGLLCSKCNSMLGFCNDSIDILLGAIDYLGGV